MMRSMAASMISSSLWFRRVVGDEAVGNGPGAAQIVRSDGVGVADRLDIHHPQPALDQHGSNPPLGTDKARARVKFHGGKPGVWPPNPGEKQNAPDRKPGPMRLGKSRFGLLAAGLLRSRLGRFGRRNSQRRYR